MIRFNRFLAQAILFALVASQFFACAVVNDEPADLHTAAVSILTTAAGYMAAHAAMWAAKVLMGDEE